MDKRFVKRLPNSAAGPSYKLTLPHQIVHKFLLHLLDADIELASHANAKQVWHGSIAPRRNKERSEFTLQGWRLFAEAHKMQAGDQVAFELVGERRLVAQVIKPVDTTYPETDSPRLVAALSQHKALQQRKRNLEVACEQKKRYRHLPRDAEVPDMDLTPHMHAMYDINRLQYGGKWKEMSEVLSCGQSNSASHQGMESANHHLERRQVPEWLLEEACLPLSPEPIDGHSQISMDSSISNTRSPVASPSNDQLFSGYQPYSDAENGCLLFQDLLHKNIPLEGTDFPMPKNVFEPSMQSESLAMPFENHTKADGCFSAQSLRRPSDAATVKVETNDQRVTTMRSKVDFLQTSLKQHSRTALKAALALEKQAFDSGHPAGIQSEMATFFGQLKDSLSQLLILSVDDDHLAAPVWSNRPL